MGSSRCTSLAGTAFVVALLLAAPRPNQAVVILMHPSAAADPLAPVLAAVSVLAWALTGWLLLVCLTTAAEQLPGLLGWSARLLGHRIAPRAIRHAAALALGVSALTGVVGTEAALAATPATAVAASTSGPSAPPALDWPTSPTVPTSIAIAGSTAAAAPARDEQPTAVAPTVEGVLVRPGDSLWVIAERQLPRTASAAQVSASWPRWWAANRSVIGADPDLIQPGVRLAPPPLP